VRLSALLVVVAALACKGVAATPPSRQLLLEAPLSLSAAPAPSGVGTELLLWPGLRAAAMLPLSGSFVAGGDLGVAASGAFAGTSVVNASRALLALDARALLGLSLGGRFTRLTPYAFAGLVGTGGLTALRGGATARTLFVAHSGARGGGGVLVRLGWTALRLELGGGVVAGRPSVVSSFALGVALR
jgi:hypothetical protein